MRMPSAMMDLLARHKDECLAQPLLEKAAASDGFDTTGPIVLPQVRDIYRQRAKHNESIGSPIEGFPELVSGLEAFAGDAVTIFHIRFGAGDYAVFADADLSELAGILKFPKRTAAQDAFLADSQRQYEAALASSRLQTI